MRTLLDSRNLNPSTILLIVLHCLGWVLVCVGLFLSEDEENRFQNSIEQWWIRLDDAQIASRSRVASFMQGVASLTERGFNRLFGPRLFSLRVIPVSIYLSLASCFLLFVIVWPWMKYSGPATRHAAFLIFAYFVALALIPALTRSRFVLALWWAIIPAFLVFGLGGFTAFLFKTRGSHFTLKLIGYVSLVFGWSLVFDLIYIALTRFVLGRA